MKKSSTVITLTGNGNTVYIQLSDIPAKECRPEIIQATLSSAYEKTHSQKPFIISAFLNQLSNDTGWSWEYLKPMASIDMHTGVISQHMED